MARKVAESQSFYKKRFKKNFVPLRLCGKKKNFVPFV